MRRLITAVFFLAGLCLLMPEAARMSAAPQKNFQCSSIGIGCGVCNSDNSPDGNPGCWVWGGGPYHNCIQQNGFICNQQQANVVCVAIWFDFGSCSGSPQTCGTPNKCCISSGINSGIQQKTNNDSCVP